MRFTKDARSILNKNVGTSYVVLVTRSAIVVYEEPYILQSDCSDHIKFIIFVKSDIKDNRTAVYRVQCRLQFPVNMP